jgi:LmbE family N-acetylglucosaminyl deacetylase
LIVDWTMMEGYDRLYLSPHYDDAALSCGGTIHQQSRAGLRVLVLTIFAAPPAPDQPLSTLARRLHQQMGDAGDITSIRRAEDGAAMAILGASSHWLDLRDSIYRSSGAGEWLYPRMSDLFGPVHTEDAGLVEMICDAVLAHCQPDSFPVLYAPMGVGNHVDHQLTRQAAWQLHEQGYQLTFYEDYPYSDPAYRPSRQSRYGHPLQAAVTVVEAAGASCELVELSEADLQARIDSACAYRSQLGDVLDPVQVVGKHIRDFAKSYDPPRKIERYWTLVKR